MTSAQAVEAVNQIVLTKEQEEFIKQLEEEFKDRYTENDEEFRKLLNEDLPPPPVEEFSRGNPYRRNNWRNERYENESRDRSSHRDYESRERYSYRDYENRNVSNKEHSYRNSSNRFHAYSDHKSDPYHRDRDRDREHERDRYRNSGYQY